MANRLSAALVSQRGVWTALSLMLVLSGGCSGGDDEWVDGRPPVYPVSGQVSYQDKPLEGANVIFSPVEGSHGAAGRTDSEGRFILTTFTDGDGAPAGRYRVTVLKAESVVTYRPDDPEHRQPPLKTEQKHLIPEKYSTQENSGLTAEVTDSDDNEFQFELTD